MTHHSVVLIVPPLSLEQRYGREMKHFGAVTEPLGLAYLAANLETHHIPVSIIDGAAEELSWQDIRRRIRDLKPSLIGLSLLTPSFEVVQQLCGQLKAEFQDTSIILGGPHCTALPEQTLKEIPGADLVCMGEGEETLVAVAGDRSNTGWEDILGICYRTPDRGIRKNPPRPFIRNIDEIPMPARHLLPMDRYRLTASRTSGDAYCPTIIVARGCPFGCTYCSHTFGRKIRFHSIGRILEEIHWLIQNYDIRQLNIEADTLTANKKFVRGLCRALISGGLSTRLKWTCESRVDTVDADILKLMKRAGCWQISYGFETGSQRLLDHINKSVTLEQMRETMAATRRAGISVRGFFMLGLPTESREESRETIRFARELDPLWAQFTLTTPYPGTPMFAQLCREKKIRNFDWKNYNTWSGWKDNGNLPFIAEGRRVEELLALQKTALRQFYMRPRVFLRFLLSVRSPSDFMKYALGLWVLVKTKFSS